MDTVTVYLVVDPIDPAYLFTLVLGFKFDPDAETGAPIFHEAILLPFPDKLTAPVNEIFRSVPVSEGEKVPSVVPVPRAYDNAETEGYEYDKYVTCFVSDAVFPRLSVIVTFTDFVPEVVIIPLVCVVELAVVVTVFENAPEIV